jgi:hypothetical protein
MTKTAVTVERSTSQPVEPKISKAPERTTTALKFTDVLAEWSDTEEGIRW